MKQIKFTVLTVLMTLLTPLLYGQQVVAENEVGILNGDKDRFSLKTIVKDPSGDGYLMYATLQRWGRVSRPQGQKSLTAGRETYYPALMVFKLDENLNLVDKKTENFNVNDLEEVDISTPYTLLGSIQQEVGGHDTDKPVEEIKKTYPEAFYDYGTAVRSLEIIPSPAFRAHQMMVSDVQSAYSSWCNCVVTKIDDKVIKTELPFTDEKTLFFEGTASNPAAGSIVVMGGPKSKKDKLATFKEPVVVTYDHNGKIINKKNLTYSFPRYPLFAAPVETKEPVSLLILGQVPRLGKNNDPDDANYDILVVNNSGAVAYQYPFKYGSKKRKLKPQYVFGNDNDIYLFTKGLGGDPVYSLLKFAREGQVYEKSFDASVAKEKTIGPYFKGLQGLGVSRFEPHGNYILNNGEVIIYGESKTMTAASSYAANGSVIPEQYIWEGFVFLHFDQEGELINQYVLEKLPEIGIATPLFLEALFDNEGRIWFAASLQSGKKSSRAEDVMPAIAANRPLSKPVLIPLDLKNKKVGYFNAEMESTELLNFTEYNNIFWNEEEATFIMAGFSKDHVNGKRLKLVKIRM